MHDLVIIGGGPSASVERKMGKLGLNTLMFEKKEFHRYKLCGEGFQNMRILISRKEFDIFLPEKAKETGIEVQTKEKVLCYEEMPTYVEVETNKTVYNAKFALVAE